MAGARPAHGPRKNTENGTQVDPARKKEQRQTKNNMAKKCRDRAKEHGTELGTGPGAGKGQSQVAASCRDGLIPNWVKRMSK